LGKATALGECEKNGEIIEGDPNRVVDGSDVPIVRG
jgi:hypothetical protein